MSPAFIFIYIYAIIALVTLDVGGLPYSMSFSLRFNVYDRDWSSTSTLVAHGLLG